MTTAQAPRNETYQPPASVAAVMEQVWNSLTVVRGRGARCPECGTAHTEVDLKAPQRGAMTADQLAARPGCQVIQQTGNYVYATCQTRLLKFTDDLEFLLDAPADLIQVRSSSRLGRKDLGVNRARIESIRARFLVAQASGATAAA